MSELAGGLELKRLHAPPERLQGAQYPTILGKLAMVRLSTSLAIARRGRPTWRIGGYRRQRFSVPNSVYGTSRCVPRISRFTWIKLAGMAGDFYRGSELASISGSGRRRLEPQTPEIRSALHSRGSTVSPKSHFSSPSEFPASNLSRAADTSISGSESELDACTEPFRFVKVWTRPPQRVKRSVDAGVQIPAPGGPIAAER